MIIVPTRICSTSASILDHFLCNNKKKISKSGDIPVCLSDHFMTFCTRKLIRIKSSLPKTLKIRSLKNNCKETFVNNLLLADWNPCFLSNDINSAWVSLKNIFNCILDEVAPVKEVCLKIQSELWLTSDILDNIKIRDSFLHQLKRIGKREDFKQFAIDRNKVQRDIKLAKSAYFTNKIEDNRFEPKKLWQSLKTLGYENGKNDTSNAVLNIENEVCHSSIKNPNIKELHLKHNYV